MTEAGREYLTRCDSPNRPIPRQKNGSVTEQLVNDVIVAGGSLKVPDRPKLLGGVDFRQRVRLAERYGKVPDGKELVVRRLSYDELQIDLVDAPGHGDAPPLRPVPIPARVTRPHPAVAAFRKASGTLQISRAAVPRAARLLQGLVAEAEQRGYQVSFPQPHGEDHRRNNWRHSAATVGKAVVSIAADGHSSSVSISEEGLPSRRWFNQRNGSYRYGRSGIGEWVPPSQASYETGATGRLTFSLVGYSNSGRPQSWSDRKSWSLDEKLPELLREIEVRAVEARARKLEEERKAAERRRAWEAAMERARAQFLQQRRAEALARQIELWRRANDIREYCAAVEETHPESPAGAEWITWARGYSDRIDPLTYPPAMPADPEEISPDDLKPYLGRWNPYGPDRW